MVRRPDYDAELIGMLESTVGCPAITTAGAEVAALTHATTKKLALSTPHPEQMTLKEKEYLEMTVAWLESSFPPVVGSVFRIGHRRHRANGGLSGITEHRHRSSGRPVSQRGQLKDSRRGTIDRIGLVHACFLGYSGVDVGGFRQAWKIR